MKHQPVREGQTATLGTVCPALFVECVGSLTSSTNHNTEDAGDGTYDI